MKFRFASSNNNYSYNYKWWCDFLGTRTKASLSTNTEVTLSSEGLIRFWLHGTNIVTLSSLNRYQYNSDLYYTFTTKKRMNQMGPVYIYQRDYKWYYDNEVGDRIEYEDFMIVDRSGRRFREL